ncbi:DUF2478 domain-containing protein [Aurantimonas marina]|uniref:DUF2478 domain-containing protein n=1 Tax=Aurantimonas marina TaxID=2780508 RepID=UPI0019D27367|nr:DUF2478 domain-containing protein [Aurantimonas marina]
MAHGFRDLIAEAVAAGIPVLTGINGLNRPALEAFTDGMAEVLPTDLSVLLAWVRSGRGRGRDPRAQGRDETGQAADDRQVSARLSCSGRAGNPVAAVIS